MGKGTVLGTASVGISVDDTAFRTAMEAVKVALNTMTATLTTTQAGVRPKKNRGWQPKKPRNRKGRK